jgi:hypothetical protein
MMEFAKELSVLTNDHGAYHRMIENPACGDVGHTEAPVAAADVPKNAQKILKQGPRSPGLYDHVEILQIQKSQSEQI